MKVEVVESLAVSWLRHVRHCQIVQLNWKPSVESIEKHLEHVSPVALRAKAAFLKQEGRALFSQSTSPGQLLRQGEIDALGVHLNGAKVAELVAVDVAFHESGLNYGGGDATTARVAMKLLRNALMLRFCLEQSTGKVVFATPLATPATVVRLKAATDWIRKFLATQKLAIDVDVWANEDFFREFYEPVVERENQVADTSELTMRALKLASLMKKFR